MPGNKRNVAIILSHEQQLKLFFPIIDSANKDNRLNLFLVNYSENQIREIENEIALLGSVRYVHFKEKKSVIKFLKKNNIETILIEYIGLTDLKNSISTLKLAYLQHSTDIVSVFPSNNVLRYAISSFK